MGEPTRRILLVTERFPPDLGGVARSGFRTAHAMAGLGFEVHVLAWTKTQQAGELTSQTSRATRTGSRPTSVHLHRLGLFSNWDMSLQHTSNVMEWLHDAHDFGLLWGHYIYPAGFLAVMFAEANCLNSIVSARGNDIDRLMFPPGDFARLHWTLQRASAITTVSRDLAGKIDVLLKTNGRAHVVHNSVDLEVFRPQAPDQTLRRNLGIGDEDVILGFCGEMRHKKGLPFLLSCLDEVNRSRPARLLVIGAVRPREQAQLTSFFVEHPELEERVIATGVLETPMEVSGYIRLCDVMLLPSVWEGLPNALLEAMACEVIPIASDAGGIPEVIEHQVDGFIIPKSRLNRLGEATLEVLGQTPAVLDPIRKSARKKVEQQFSHILEDQRLQTLLQHVLPD